MISVSDALTKLERVGPRDRTLTMLAFSRPRSFKSPPWVSENCLLASALLRKDVLMKSTVGRAILSINAVKAMLSRKVMSIPVSMARFSLSSEGESCSL